MVKVEGAAVTCPVVVIVLVVVVGKTYGNVWVKVIVKHEDVFATLAATSRFLL